MVRVLYMGKNYLSIKSVINLYEALIRSQLEYGTEIWGFNKFIKKENRYNLKWQEEFYMQCPLLAEKLY